MGAYRFGHGRVAAARRPSGCSTASRAGPSGRPRCASGSSSASRYAAAETDSLAAGLGGLDEAARHARRLPAGPERAELDGLVLAHRGLLLHRAGRVAEGLELFDEADPAAGERHARRHRRPVGARQRLPQPRHVLHLPRPRSRGAAGDFARCVAVCDEYGLALLAAKARHNLGYVAYMTGDLPTALRHYDEAEHELPRARTGCCPRCSSTARGRCSPPGLAADAARQLDDAIPRLREQRAGQDLAEAEVARAAAALLDGQVDDARRRARVGGAQLHQAGQRPLGRGRRARRAAGGHRGGAAVRAGPAAAAGARGQARGDAAAAAARGRDRARADARGPPRAAPRRPGGVASCCSTSCRRGARPRRSTT